MGWSCKACTFLNKADDAVACEICGTERESPPAADGTTQNDDAVKKPKAAAAAAAATTKKSNNNTKSRQANLFGGFLTDEQEKASKKKPTKKRSAKAAYSSAMTDDEQQQQRPPPKKKSAPQSNAAAAAAAAAAASSSHASSKQQPYKRSANGTRTAATTTVPVPAHLQVKDNSMYSLQDLSKEAQRIMKETFGIQKLRNLQPQAVQYALRRQSQLIIMATGGGKSLCYQLPALVRNGTTVVVSPLKALIEDQVNALIEKGVASAFISSSNTQTQNNRVFERLLQRSLKPNNAAGKKSNNQATLTALTGGGSQKQPQQPAAQIPPISLLYCTPEQVKTDRFRECLMVMNEQNRLASFAIDEAHCLSSWGHDFRPAYLQLGWLREKFPHIPLMACTATATPKVVADIKKTLNLEDRPELIGSFDRKNIFYKVRYKDVLDMMSPKGAQGDLMDFIRNQHNRTKQTATDTTTGQQQQQQQREEEQHQEPCSGIVYVHKQKETLALARAITKETGIRAEAYHGKMKDAERQSVQQAWTAGKCQIAVATIAFGMGIDLAHVRYVVHWNLAKNVESFYQESGRAGRDGKPAYSLLYYSRSDANTFQYFANLKKSKKDSNAVERELKAVQNMVEYCMEPGGCRRRYLLQFFGDPHTDPKTVCQGSCDYCVNPDKVTRAIEAASCAHDHTFHTRPAKAAAVNNDGQWTRPHGDDDIDEFSADDGDWDSSTGLKITGGRGDDNEMPWLPAQNDSKPTASGFVKASAILDKYEAIECQENKANGFIRFRSKDDTGTDGATKKPRAARPALPEHLRASAPDPLSHFEAKPASSTTMATSSDAAAEVARLKAESEKAAKAAQAAKEALAARTKKRAPPPPPPPPPSLSFSKKKRR